MSQLLGFTLDAILRIFGSTYIDLDHKYSKGYQLNCIHGRSKRDGGQFFERQETMNNPSADGGRTVKPFWPPMAAGIALGLALLFTFLITGHGLGASGAATDVVAGTGLTVAPAATQSNLYLASKVADGNPIGSWMTWEVLGLFIGALVAAFMAGRFRVQLDGARSVGTTPRLVRALAGGLLAGFGARVAGGCTSGLGLSGAAALGIAAFVFLALFFATGLIVNRIVRGV
jgi:uncharacterized membrane protein YedE/YeeE